MRTLADNYATPIAARPAPHPQSALQLASRSAASRHNGCRRRSDRRRCSSAFRQRRQVLAATGRIVQWGLESRWINPGGTGEANPCSFWCGGRAKAKRKRNFSDGHSERWRKEDRHKGIQMDHMTLTLNGRTFKEFRAVCPKTRRQHAKEFSRATAGTAKAHNPSRWTAALSSGPTSRTSAPSGGCPQGAPAAPPRTQRHRRAGQQNLKNGVLTGNTPAKPSTRPWPSISTTTTTDGRTVLWG